MLSRCVFYFTFLSLSKGVVPIPSRMMPVYITLPNPNPNPDTYLYLIFDAESPGEYCSVVGQQYTTFFLMQTFCNRNPASIVEADREGNEFSKYQFAPFRTTVLVIFFYEFDNMFMPQAKSLSMFTVWRYKLWLSYDFTKNIYGMHFQPRLSA